jgi:hypothetical protein
MHFSCDDPAITIYTADFSISADHRSATETPERSPPPDDISAHTPNPEVENAQQTMSMAVDSTGYSDSTTYTEAPVYRPVATLFAQNETITMTYAPTKSQLADTTVYEPNIAPWPTMPFLDQQGHAGAGEDAMGVVYRKKSGHGARFVGHGAGRVPRNPGLGRWETDANRLKFRAVFLLWPALIGLSMAL